MSAAGVPGGGGGNAAPQQYFCHECQRHVIVAPPPSPTAELECPDCHGGFLEESDNAPPSNPANMTPNSPVVDNFPASAAFSNFGDGVGRIHNISARLRLRSPNDINSFASLRNNINNLMARGARVEVVFERPSGGWVDFTLPTNLGDYYTGHNLEDFIQRLDENDPDRYGTPPASKSAVEGLPDIKITDEMLTSESSQCAVCKDSFEVNEEVKQMHCKHIYHKDCILPWLELHNSCPVCRYELPTDDPDYENRRTGQMNDNTIGNSNSSNLGLGAAVGSGESRDGSDRNNNSPQTAQTEERTIEITLHWPLRAPASPAETSSGWGGAASSDSGNNSTNNGTSSAGAEEDFDGSVLS